MELVLIVRRPPGEAFVYRFASAEIAIGRGPTAQVRLPDETISSIHVRLRKTEGGYVAIDTGSTGGTMLGAQRLVAQKAYPLRDADALAIGPYLVEVFLDEGGGLTTDERDSARLAAAIAMDMAPAGWAAWVLRGSALGQVAQLLAEKSVTLGSDPSSTIIVADGPPRQAELGLDERRRLVWVTPIDGSVTLRGRALTGRTQVARGDLLTIGSTLIEVRGPPPLPPPSWTLLEGAAIAAIVAALATGLMMLL